MNHPTPFFRPFVFFLLTLFLIVQESHSQNISLSGRESQLFDSGWKFSYGHPYDAVKDFDHGTGYFSYYAKAGYGDGPAAPYFDDRAWRVLDLPHDFAVEQPFDHRGSHSHGYKAIGRNFPEVSVGWYRKTFTVPETDEGRRISLTFEGVHRDSKVWINGHFLGNEASGYNTFSYDISAYLNYGGENVVAVRADVTYEEGWYYEGAGIYRHVWLTKTHPLHVAQYGTFVKSEIKDRQAFLNIETTVANENLNAYGFSLKQELRDAEGRVVAQDLFPFGSIDGSSQIVLLQDLVVEDPRLWSIEDPYLYTLVSSVIKNGETVDQYTTPVGIRTIRFDADKGFFLNGKPVKLKGTNNHQDHAGVGTAMPDELLAFRISKLKEMGSNAIRSSHNPASPALLDVCDRLGMLVIDEHRLMGTAPFVKDQLERMIKRDRNHPSVVVWSLGNEEWAIEGNVTGERIIREMQAFANHLDPTRPKNAASSGSWGKGVSKPIEVMGFNYLNHGSTDEYHKNFPNTPTIGTEEGSTNTTRGIYRDDPARQHLTAYDQPTPNGYFFSIEHCWKHYDSREYLSGMFIWTGFDYRGEPTPFGWPSVHSYFGMYDVCGFPKDNVFYLKSWWGNEPVLHLLPHWNQAGKDGAPVKVVAYSNCDEVELFVNKRSAGKKTIEKNGHAEWMVAFRPGSIKAVGYKNKKKLLEKMIETTGPSSALRLGPHKSELAADKRDVAVFAVSTVDQKGRFVPTAENKVWFEIEGPGTIIGVGNGDPSCHEADKLVDRYLLAKIQNLKACLIDGLENRREVALGFDDAAWKPARQMLNEIQKAAAVVFRGTFELPELTEGSSVRLFYNSIGDQQKIYINGKLISEALSQNDNPSFELASDLVQTGKNEIAVVAIPFKVRNPWDSPNSDPGTIQVLVPAPPYSRSLFSGYAQVIVQPTGEEGLIKLTARSEGIQPAAFEVPVKKEIMIGR